MLTQQNKHKPKPYLLIVVPSSYTPGTAEMNALIR